MTSVRVLVVDDSATMRKLVSSCLSSDPDIEVVGAACNAAEAREMIKRLNPDVMTLDVEMPDMTGIEFLTKVMSLRPMPVIMVSTLTAAGSETAIEALEIGAVDCVVKPTTDNPSSLETLPSKVKMAKQANVRLRRSAISKPTEKSATLMSIGASSAKIVAIGSSTGGVEALLSVLAAFPENCTPTVITQHMPPLFTATLAQRLNRVCRAKVAEAVHGSELKRGHIYLAPGGNRHLQVVGHDQFHCTLKEGPLVNGHCPSVDVLFESVSKAAGASAIGAILTGMGRDGALGLKAMQSRGARTIGQDQASSVVYGMPKAAFELGAVDKQVSLSAIGSEIVKLMA